MNYKTILCVVVFFCATIMLIEASLVQPREDGEVDGEATTVTTLTPDSTDATDVTTVGNETETTTTTSAGSNHMLSLVTVAASLLLVSFVRL